MHDKYAKALGEREEYQAEFQEAILYNDQIGGLLNKVPIPAHSHAVSHDFVTFSHPRNHAPIGTRRGVFGKRDPGGSALQTIGPCVMPCELGGQ